MLTVWGRISSINVRKVILAAQWLGLDFKRTDAGSQFGIVKSPAYLAMNPNALVPVVDDGGFVLWESNVIVRYLCAKYAPALPMSRGSAPAEGALPASLYPSDLRARFNAERWMDWQQTTLNPAGRNAFIQWVRTLPEQRDAALIAKSVAAMQPLLAMLDSHLSQHAFVGGDALSMADITLVCEIHRWWGLPQPRAPWPHVERWYQGLLAMPASRGVLDQPLS